MDTTNDMSYDVFLREAGLTPEGLTQHEKRVTKFLWLFGGRSVSVEEIDAEGQKTTVSRLVPTRIARAWELTKKLNEMDPAKRLQSRYVEERQTVCRSFTAMSAPFRGDVSGFSRQLEKISVEETIGVKKVYVENLSTGTWKPIRRLWCQYVRGQKIHTEEYSNEQKMEIVQNVLADKWSLTKKVFSFCTFGLLPMFGWLKALMFRDSETQKIYNRAKKGEALFDKAVVLQRESFSGPLRRPPEEGWVDPATGQPCDVLIRRDGLEIKENSTEQITEIE